MDKRPGSFANWQDGFSSCADMFLDHEASYECRSTNPGTGGAFVCRRSPRLLMNGYYVLTEDSVLSDEDGNVTLSLSQTSITYKEKLIRIFRRRKRIRRSLASLFNISAADSWMNSTACSDRNAHFVDDSWLERDSEMDASLHDNKESCTARKDICQMLLLSTGVIISLGARFFLGGLFTALLSCLLLFLLICKLSA